MFLFVFTSTNCKSNNKEEKSAIDTKMSPSDLQKYETAYFAAGCFWCVEAIFESVEGVHEVISGYSGGKETNPTYEDVGYGRTTHAEAVEIYYDPKVISYSTLVQIFFGSHDPTTLNRQGPDKGAQYRSVAFYKNDEEKKIIDNTIAQLQANKTFTSPIITQVIAFKKFYKGEDYHQDYEKRNPNNPYIQSVSVPRLQRFMKKFPELLKKKVH